MADGFEIFRAASLADAPHGFFGSSGGAHQFGYGGPGVPEQVHALRARAAHVICDGAALITPHQVHSPNVISVVELWEDAPEGRPVADALVTARAGAALGIVTADCAPVLFADREAGVVGAAHAGWRGAHGGVLANTVSAMEALGARRDRIAAAIGPTIAQPHYEVDAPFRQNFSADAASHFHTAPRREGIDRWHFDLPGYVAARLRDCGLNSVENTVLDTWANPEQFFSYRRARQKGEGNYGRQISLIAL